MLSRPNRDQREEETDIREVAWVLLSLFGGVLHVRHLLALVRAPGGSCEAEGVCEG